MQPSPYVLLQNNDLNSKGAITWPSHIHQANKLSPIYVSLGCLPFAKGTKYNNH